MLRVSRCKQRRKKPADARSLKINTITLGDVRDSLVEGIHDFLKKPQYGLFFGAF